VGLVEGKSLDEIMGTIQEEEHRTRQKIILHKMDELKILIDKYEPKVIRWLEEKEYLKKQLD